MKINKLPAPVTAVQWSKKDCVAGEIAFAPDLS
jgi:hypothetical protein